jgi:hypothetical protein
VDSTSTTGQSRSSLTVCNVLSLSFRLSYLRVTWSCCCLFTFIVPIIEWYPRPRGRPYIQFPRRPPFISVRERPVVWDIISTFLQVNSCFGSGASTTFSTLGVFVQKTTFVDLLHIITTLPHRLSCHSNHRNQLHSQIKIQLPPHRLQKRWSSCIYITLR